MALLKTCFVCKINFKCTEDWEKSSLDTRKYWKQAFTYSKAIKWEDGQQLCTKCGGVIKFINCLSSHFQKEDFEYKPDPYQCENSLARLLYTNTYNAVEKLYKRPTTPPSVFGYSVSNTESGSTTNSGGTVLTVTSRTGKRVLSQGSEYSSTETLPVEHTPNNKENRPLYQEDQICRDEETAASSTDHLSKFNKSSSIDNSPNEGCIPNKAVNGPSNPSGKVVGEQGSAFENSRNDTLIS